MKNFKKTIIFTASMLCSFSAYADLSVVTGEYTVANKDCLDTGNSKGSAVSITATGEKLSVKIDGDNPVTIHMLEGKVESTLANGNSFERNGVTYGNGFAYGEIEKNGRFYVSDIEYTLNWEDGELVLTKTERVDASHKTKVYCDLKPVK